MDDRNAFDEAIGKLNLEADIFYLQDAKELMEYLSKDRDINLILLDINMPVMDGKKCLKELKSSELYKNIPVIIYTVSTNTADIDETYEQGAHYYVVKPYAKVNFDRTLQKIFSYDWKESQSIPLKEHYVINLAFV
jgi:PleD family two-component response regulator